MKKQVIDFIIIILLISTIYIKDLVIYQNNQIKIIESVIDHDLSLKLEDYNRLLNENNIPKQNGFKCITRIKNQQINLFYNYISIYNNKNCHLSENDIVLNENGLLGTIVKVFKKSAIVELISNPGNNISIQIGSAFGTMKAKNGILYIDDITEGFNIEKGDKVLTSGLTTIPKGLNVGTISNVWSIKSQNIFEIKPTANITDGTFLSIYGELE